MITPLNLGSCLRGRIADGLRGAFALAGAPAALPAGDDQEDEDVIEAVPAEIDQPNV